MSNLEALESLISANPGWSVALALPALVAYFAPLLIAFERRHRFLLTIGAINLAAGWTVLGWVAVLVWAVNKDVKSLADELPVPMPESPLEPQWNLLASSEASPAAGDLRRCPYCAEHIRAGAIVCRFCSRDLGEGAQVAPTAGLEEHERRRLETLLSEATAQGPSDPSLLDVFEYARLLEAEESAAILARVGVANLPTQPRPGKDQVRPSVAPLKDQVESFGVEDSDADWVLNTPVAGRGG